MNSDKKEIHSGNNEYEVSLVDIYLSVKRNRKLFFVVILASFLISLLATYYKFQPTSHKENGHKISSAITEYSMWIEIGTIYRANGHNNRIDSAINALEKVKNIYIPKVVAEFNKTKGSVLKSSSISVMTPRKSQLLFIKITKTTDLVDYEKVLMTLANYLFKNHNDGLNSNYKNIMRFTPTKIIDGPSKTVAEAKVNKKSKLLIPILGLVLGIFFAFGAVFVKEFLTRVKEAESSV